MLFYLSYYWYISSARLFEISFCLLSNFETSRFPSNTHSLQSRMATLIAGHYDFVKADAAFEQYLIATGSFDGFVGTVYLAH
jgi:hypothetical protein